MKLVLEWERRWDEGEGRTNFGALRRELGISRQQGYPWVDRDRAAGVQEPSRRPHSSPTKVTDELEDVIVRAGV